MSIVKQYTDPVTYATFDHWDMVSLSNDPINNVTACSLGLFVSETAENNGASPLVTLDFTFDGLLTEGECYTAIVANYQAFTGATIT